MGDLRREIDRIEGELESWLEGAEEAVRADINFNTKKPKEVDLEISERMHLLYCEDIEKSLRILDSMKAEIGSDHDEFTPSKVVVEDDKLRERLEQLYDNLFKYRREMTKQITKSEKEGVIKTISSTFGYITPSEMGQADYFFLYTSLVGDPSKFKPGAHVTFERVPTKKNEVTNVRLVESSSIEPVNLQSEDSNVGGDLKPVSAAGMAVAYINSLLESTKDYTAFEDAVFTLLVATGINTIYKFPAKNQAGKPDGYFQCGNLSVIYDATLRDGEEMLAYKQAQIENYAARLNSGRINIDASEFGSNSFPPRSFGVFDRQKEVWIVNRTQESRILQKIDGTVVKVIGADDIVDVLLKRLHVTSIDSEYDLAKDLALLGQRSQ